MSLAEDFAVNVRQIAQYPQAIPALNDVFLFQQGGVGGPYRSAQTRTLFAGLGDLGVNFPGFGLVGNALTTPPGTFRQGFNWFLDSTATVRYRSTGYASRWAFDSTAGLVYGVSAWGTAGNSIPPAWSELFSVDLFGNAAVAQQLKVGRPPFSNDEVVSLGYLKTDAVTSFNGRSGRITLSNDDLSKAIGAEPGDPLLSQSMADALICRALNDWYLIAPLVFSFNGRVGDITLAATDVSCALFADRFRARAPTPSPSDVSTRIATTEFVADLVADTKQTIIIELTGDVQQVLDYLNLNFAPLNSPNFTGIATAPTPPPMSNDGTLATTAFVRNLVQDSTTGVISFNGRTGVITFTAQDVSDAGGALLNSPSFTGTPTAPTQAIGDNSTAIATTAWVLGEIAAVSAGVTTFNGRSGDVILAAGDITTAGGALLASPNFSGVPTAPTAAPGTATQQLATTQFVMNNAGVATFNGRTGAVSLTGNDVSAAGGALLAGPAFTGVPTAPTAVPGTSTQQLATTAFVAAALAAGGLVNSFNGRTGAVTLNATDIGNASGAVYVQAAAPPANPTAQTLWWDTVGGAMYVYFGGAWVAAN